MSCPSHHIFHIQNLALSLPFTLSVPLLHHPHFVALVLHSKLSPSSPRVFLKHLSDISLGNVLIASPINNFIFQMLNPVLGNFRRNSYFSAKDFVVCSGQCNHSLLTLQFACHSLSAHCSH